MANTFRKIYKKTGNSGNDSDYQLVGNVGVDGVELDIMKGATSSSAGEIGLVPKPTAGQENYVLGGDGTFKTIKSILSSDGLIKNDLTTTSSGYLLDAYQGKVLNSKLSELNGKKMDTFFSPAAGEKINLYDEGRYVCLSEKSQVSNINDASVSESVGTWCFIISFVYDDTGVQFITSLFSSSAGERTIYKRSKESGNWGKWKAINVTP